MLKAWHENLDLTRKKMTVLLQGHFEWLAEFSAKLLPGAVEGYSLVGVYLWLETCAIKIVLGCIQDFNSRYGVNRKQHLMVFGGFVGFEVNCPTTRGLKL